MLDVEVIPEVDDFLEHFGVKGMHWGDRKAEPASVSIDARKTEDPQNQPEAKAKWKMSSTQKKILIGTAVAATILAVAVISYKEIDKKIEKNPAGKRAAESILLNGSIFKKDESLTGPKSIDEIMTTITPNINPKFKKVPGYNTNCRRSTFAYELNRRGHSVQATGSSIAWGQDNIGLQNALRKEGKEKISPLSLVNVVGQHGKTSNNINPYLNAFKGEKVKDPFAIGAALAKHPNGARGELVMNVTKKGLNNKKTQFYGHSMAWEKIDGKSWIIDTQTNRHWEADDAGLAKLFKGWGSPSEASILRLDDKELNMGFLSRWAENRG